jgi:dUTP pyrophosphatase
MDIKIKKLHPTAVIPQYAKDGDAGLDLTCTKVNFTDDYTEYETGLAIEIPPGFCGLLMPRSSNCKYDQLLCNSVGLIDSGYRGPINFRYKNVQSAHIQLDDWPLKAYRVGDRVGQLLIMPYPSIQLVEVEELGESERGETGFGSTNVLDVQQGPL